MAPGGRLTFGPYQLDASAKQLRRGTSDVILPAAQFAILCTLARQAPNVVRKEALVQAAWKDVAVNDSSLHQAISSLRATLDAENRERYIQGVSRQGYRFVEPVAHVDVRLTDAELDALVAPNRSFIDGCAALESLERDRIAAARVAFEQLTRHDDDDGVYHLGFACACALAFEATRADEVPDREALAVAVKHAREACRLAPEHGEAWATFGFVTGRVGDQPAAVLYLRRAVKLDDQNWRHHVRLAFVSWGQERWHAAKRALAMMPNCPLAHWLAATVLVARGTLDAAEREVDAGLAARTHAPGTAARFTAVGLYWLKGLLCLARGADDEAMTAFGRELALEGSGHLYARESCANAWYATGALRSRRGDTAGARAAFEQAIARVSRHPMAHAGLAILNEVRGIDARADARPASMDAAMARAAILVAHGDAPAAARVVGEALRWAPPGSAGWLLPIEPLLNVQRERAAWDEVLTLVGERAV